MIYVMFCWIISGEMGTIIIQAYFIIINYIHIVLHYEYRLLSYSYLIFHFGLKRTKKF